MNFGNHLRRARESRGWTRFRLEVAIREKFPDPSVHPPKEDTIKAIERSVSSSHRGTTIAFFVAVFPELIEFIPNYPQSPREQVAAFR